MRSMEPVLKLSVPDSETYRVLPTTAMALGGDARVTLEMMVPPGSSTTINLSPGLEMNRCAEAGSTRMRPKECVPSATGDAAAWAGAGGETASHVVQKPDASSTATIRRPVTPETSDQNMAHADARTKRTFVLDCWD